MREVRQAAVLPGFEPEIGRWLWAMEETRRGTLATVQELPQHILDWEGPTGDENAIGSLLYHLALVELSWLYEDILEQEISPEVRAEFPHPMGSAEGRLAQVLSVPLADHLGRLARSRAMFLEAMRGMTCLEWWRLRRPTGVPYDVTPEWAVFHLLEHEAGHLFQIRAMKTRARRAFGR